MTASTYNPFNKEVYYACKRLYEAITLDDRIPKKAQYVAHLLINKSFQKGYAWPSLDFMVNKLKISKPSIIGFIKKLESLEYLRVKRPDRPGRGIANQYYPLFQRFLKPRKTEAKPLEKGKVSPSEKGKAAFTSVDSEIEVEAKASTSPSESIKKQKKQGALRHDALPADVKEVADKVRKEVGPISEYREFEDKVLRNDNTLKFFIPLDMTVSALRRSINAFTLKKLHEATWKDLDTAVYRVVRWLSNEKWRGDKWGEPCYD